MKRSGLTLLAVLCGCLFTMAQEGKCTFKNGEFVIEINKSMQAAQLKDFIVRYDLNELDLKTVLKTNDLDTLAKLGWKIVVNNSKMLTITKALSGSTNVNNPNDNTVFESRSAILKQFPATGNGVVFGVNQFKNKYPFAVKDSVVTFFLRNYLHSNRVMLAGSFNAFEPDALPMKKTDSGWIAYVKLGPGKYWYKFIDDGSWIVDGDNNTVENDGMGNTNSVYYKTNFTFDFKGHTTAKKVYVLGSFNNWEKRQLPMTKISTGWVLPIYLANGTHTFKFLADNVYYNDNVNFETLPDGNGGNNSVIRLGKAYTFQLAGYPNAHHIILSGSFNNWNEHQLEMRKTATGWELPYVLGSGNYQYKFIVDGNWILDPANPLTASTDGFTNSYLIIGANYTFHLKAYPNAKQVFLAGDFNNWDPKSLAMKKQGQDWICSVHLSAGKHKYKFVVDDNWITDPDNKQWDDGDNGNSVVWVE